MPRMNRFERAVYECMEPTAQLLEQTQIPLHRAMLLNFWRHIWPYDSRGPDFWVLGMA